MLPPLLCMTPSLCTLPWCSAGLCFACHRPFVRIHAAGQPVQHPLHVSSEQSAGGSACCSHVICVSQSPSLPRWREGGSVVLFLCACVSPHAFSPCSFMQSHRDRRTRPTPTNKHDAFTPSLLHSFTPSLLHSFTPSLIHSFTPLRLRSLMHSRSRSLTHTHPSRMRMLC